MGKKPILYMHITSPPCRAVLLTGAALGIEFKYKIINYLNAEQKDPEYIKVNTNFPFLTGDQQFPIFFD